MICHFVVAGPRAQVMWDYKMDWLDYKMDLLVNRKEKLVNSLD